MAVKIKPEVGRTLYYYPAANNPMPGSPGPLAAKVVYVHGETCVNLVVWDSNGNAHTFGSVRLAQPDCEIRPGEAYCAWMPYQIEQAETKAKFAEARANMEAAVRSQAEKTKLAAAAANLSTEPGPGKDNGPQTIATLPTAPAEDCEGECDEQKTCEKVDTTKQPPWLKK